MSTQNHFMTGRFYTAARKFQQLIGVTPAGERIPGGPYTITQFVVGLSIMAAGFITRPLWSQGILIDVFYIAIAAIGIAVLVGRMPGSRRSLVNLINCWFTLMNRPRTGTYRGRKLPASYSRAKRRTPRPTPVAPATSSSVEDSHEEPATTSSTTPAPQHVPFTSGLDRLNAHLTTASENR